MNSIESMESEIMRLISVFTALAPPLRPSPGDIECFARNWKAGDGMRVLIHGVTPELVDLAVRKNASRIVAMDRYEPFFPSMRRLGCEDWRRVEFLLGDWRAHLPELEESLDMVLGDGSLTLLSFPSEWEQVLKHTRRYLAPGGRMILRLSFQPEEPFDLELYMEKKLHRFDAECARVGPEGKFKILREFISEIRIGFGVAAAGIGGVVDLQRRSELVHEFYAEFTARCGGWKEWEAARVAMPPESDVLTGHTTGKAVPRWQDAVDLVEKCGLWVTGTKWSGSRPAPGVMRFLLAERI